MHFKQNPKTAYLEQEANMVNHINSYGSEIWDWKDLIDLTNKMKRYLPYLLVALFLMTTQIKSQVTHTIQYTVSPASCATCCDGSFTLNVTNCWTYIILSTPSLNISSGSWLDIYKTYTNVCSGTYTLNVSGSELCGPPITDYFTMPFGTGLTTSDYELGVNSLFPNPSKNFIHFKNRTVTLEKEITLEVKDLTGSLVKRIIVNSTDQVINVSDFEEGIYFVTIMHEGKLVETKKIAIVR